MPTMNVLLNALCAAAGLVVARAPLGSPPPWALVLSFLVVAIAAATYSKRVVVGVFFLVALACFRVLAEFGVWVVLLAGFAGPVFLGALLGEAALMRLKARGHVPRATSAVVAAAFIEGRHPFGLD